MTAEYYVWYRLDSKGLQNSDSSSSLSDLNIIESAARILMHELISSTGLQGRLLKREDAGAHTWMEHYAFANPELSWISLSPKKFEAALDDLERRWWPLHFPKRHTERFDLVEPKSS
jgi:hypothetical protein